jgi:UDP:flavonoid glycosyltransferase YjiC (YdhE family)
MVIIPTPGHTEQLTNAVQAKNLGVAKIVLQDTLNKERLLKCVQKLIQPETIRHTEEVQKEALKSFTATDDFAAVIQGFDLDGDGKVDAIEALE